MSDPPGGTTVRAYSMDRRVRVAAAIDAGEPPAAVAATSSVRPAGVRRLGRRRQAGATAPRPRAAHRPRIREALAAPRTGPPPSGGTS